MADREGFRHQAGGGDGKLGIVRYGRGEMTQRERPNNTGEAVMPGEALMVTTDGDGNQVFDFHDGAETSELYIAVEARGRGMDAQTDTGYEDGDVIIAKNPSGGGFNLRVATGEDIEDGDDLLPQADTGLFVEESGEGWSVAHADETKDLNGLADPELVATEVN